MFNNFKLFFSKFRIVFLSNFNVFFSKFKLFFSKFKTIFFSFILLFYPFVSIWIFIYYCKYVDEIVESINDYETDWFDVFCNILLIGGYIMENILFLFFLSLFYRDKPKKAFKGMIRISKGIFIGITFLLILESFGVFLLWLFFK